MSTNRYDVPTAIGAPPNPILLAWRLAQQRRVRRALAHRGMAAFSIAAFGLLGALIAVATWRLLRMHGAELLAQLHAHSFTLMVAAAAIGWAATARRRRRAERELAQSWLASAPVSMRDRQSALRWRVGAEVLVPFAVVLVLLVGAGLASATVITLLIAAVAVGYVAGAGIGWRSGAKTLRSRAIALPRLRQSRVATSNVASVAALGRWSFEQLRAAANPQLEVRLLGAMLVSLPMGISPWIVLLLLAFSITVMAALSLLRASLVMIPEAAAWLRATPLGLGAFVRATCLRAVVWQVVFMGVGGALIVVLGAAAGVAFALMAAWLGVCVTALASAFACRNHPARLVLELVSISVLLLAAASFSPYTLMLVWPALWVWQERRMREA